jgi:hypothetical protein
MEPSRLFTLLRGTWDFTRTIRSASDPSFLVTGLAQFLEHGPPPAALRYTERGTMEPLPASAAAAPPPPPPLPPMEVRAEHTWHFPPPSGDAAAPPPPHTAHVHFADGRHFFTLALPPLEGGRGRADFSHYCDPDSYAGTLDVEARGAGAATLQLCWRISGPKKCTEITTTFRRRREEEEGGAAGKKLYLEE